LKLRDLRAQTGELESDLSDLSQCHTLLKQEFEAHTYGCEHLKLVVAEMKKQLFVVQREKERAAQE